jgi:anti-anti-sigma factor
MTAAAQPFSVSVAPDGAFVPIGELDFATVQDLRDLVDEVMVPGRAIVLDLAQLTFIDSSVIHWLIATCQATGHPVVLRNASTTVRRLLDVASTVGPGEDAWVFDRDLRTPAAG